MPEDEEQSSNSVAEAVLEPQEQQQMAIPIDSLAVPTQADYEEVMRRNPVAAAQLKEATWKRMYVALVTQKQDNAD